MQSRRFFPNCPNAALVNLLISSNPNVSVYVSHYVLLPLNTLFCVIGHIFIENREHLAYLPVGFSVECVVFYSMLRDSLRRMIH